MPEVTSFVLSPRLVFTLTELLEGRHFCSRLCPQSLGDAWLRADAQGMFTNWPISRQSQLLGTWESSVYSSHRGPHTIEAATQHCASHSGSAWDCLFSERATWFLPLKDAKSKTGKKKKKQKSLPFCPNGINFINKHDRWRVFFSDSKQFPNKLGPVTQVLLNEFGTNHSQESGRRLVCYCFG